MKSYFYRGVCHVAEENFQQVLDDSHKQVVIVNIWAEWFKSSERPKHAFYKVVKEYKDENIKFMKYNIGDSDIAKEVGRS